MATLNSRRAPSIALVALLVMPGLARGMGEILGQPKEELKLKYDVSVYDNQKGRVTITLTIADAGRLKPLDAVELMVPGTEKEPNGGHGFDLAVPLQVTKDAQGKQVARFQITRELASRAELWLTTSTMDGKRTLMERYHYIIPVAPSVTAADERRPAPATPASKDR